MNWIADVVQEYSAIAEVDSRAGSIAPTVRKNALIAQLTLRAPSALEAMEKATEWLSQSKIENARVSQVCRNSVDEIDLRLLESWPVNNPRSIIRFTTVNKEEGL